MESWKEKSVVVAFVWAVGFLMLAARPAASDDTAIVEKLSANPILQLRECSNAYTAECVYGALAAYISTVTKDREQDEPKRRDVAESFLNAGYPELARIMALESMAASVLGCHCLSTLFHSKMLPVEIRADSLLRGGKGINFSEMLYSYMPDNYPEGKARLIEAAAEAGSLEAAEKAAEKFISTAPQFEHWFRETYGAYPLAKMFSAIALGYADRGNYGKAVEAAGRIGDSKFNQVALGWPKDGETPPAKKPSYSQEDIGIYETAVTIIGIERVLQGQDPATVQKSLDRVMETVTGATIMTGPFADKRIFYPRLLEILAGKPETKGDEHGTTHPQAMAYASILGQNWAPESYSSPRAAQAYAAIGKTEKAWEIFKTVKPPNGLEVLQALAEYYARHPDEKATQRIVGELKAYLKDSWPAIRDYDLIMMGPDPLSVHKDVFDVLETMKSAEGVEEVMREVAHYPNESLRGGVALLAAQTLALFGKSKQAWDYLDQYNKSPFVPSERSHRRRAQAEQRGPSREDGIGMFILNMASSPAAKEDKEKAISMGDVFLKDGKAGDPAFRLQLAIAKAAVSGTMEARQALSGAQYGLPPTEVALYLHQAKLHDEEKAVLESAWSAALSRFPETSGGRFRDSRFQNAGLVKISWMLARDGLFDDAEAAARTILDYGAVKKTGGTDWMTYIRQQTTLEKIAEKAARKGDAAFVKKLVANQLDYKPFQAAAYFALADQAFAGGKKADAKTFYDAGCAAAPTYADAMGMPKDDPGDIALNALVMRASLEKRLGLDTQYQKTLDFANSISKSSTEPLKLAKVSSIAVRIKNVTAKDSSGYAGGALEDFMKDIAIPGDSWRQVALRDLALDALGAGQATRARAREIVLLGLKDLERQSDMESKAPILLAYADILAKTEKKFSPPVVKAFEEIIRYGAPPRRPADNTDMVKEGEQALIELNRRAPLRDTPPMTAAERQQMAENGSRAPAGRGFDYVGEWFRVAKEKYNKEHPEAPITTPPNGTLPTCILLMKETVAFSGGCFVIPADVPHPKGYIDATMLYLSDYTCEGHFPPFCKY